ncbi:acyltransferase [Chryseolinea sp. T2]|uniref:acyltransferase family protein n=1 Tax=Chryseolinea sp. T2 TaxID=3129255 RepID=UPI0030775F81
MKLKYIESFDGLRGVAIIMLMVFHGSYGYLKGGIPRVDLFFVMSGFLITYVLYSEYQKTGNISFRNFYLNRALRIIPALIVCVVLANLVWSVSPVPELADRTIASLASLFFFANMMPAAYLGNIPHLWSVSVEEHFYLIWPALTFFLIFKLKGRARIIFLFVTIVLLEVFRVVAYHHSDTWRWGIFWIYPYAFTLCRIDCLFTGALIFFAFYRAEFNYANLRPLRYDNFYLVVLACIFVISGVVINFEDGSWLGGGFVLTNIVCALIVIIVLRNPTHPFLTHRWLKWLGVRSYGIFLYHMPIFYGMEYFRLKHDYVNLVIVTIIRFALSIGFAALSYQYLELPFLKLKNRRKKGQVVPPIGKPFEQVDSGSLMPGSLILRPGFQTNRSAARPSSFTSHVD